MRLVVSFGAASLLALGGGAAWAAPQAPGSLPRVGMDDIVNVSGCANVRAQPGLQTQIVACLPNRTTVHVIGGPVFRDGKLWWLLQGQGWMVHDSLVGGGA